MKRRTWNDRKDLALRNVLKGVLVRHRGNKTHAARELGIDRTHVQRLIDRYGLKGAC